MVISSKSISLVNHILKKIGYGEPAKQESEPSEEAKKNDTPSRRSSKECRDNSPRRDDPKGSKPSVEKKLEENKRKLERESKKQKDRTRDKSRNKQKSKPKAKER